MEFPKGTIFKEEIDPESKTKIKIAILPDGTEIRFFTEEELKDI